MQKHLLSALSIAVAVLGVLTHATLTTANVNALPKGWVDLFQPPYENCPSVMMAISCVASSSCFIAGGANGVGFGVLSFDGQPNGNFNTLNMPDMDMMLMAISVGGTADEPRGAAGGIGFGDSVQYFINSTTLMPASQPFFVVTQDLRTTADGKHVLVIDQGGSNAVLFSTNSGKNFTFYNITSLMPSAATYSRYGAIADPKTWYVTLGNWPNSGSSSASTSASTSSKDTIVLSPRTTMVRDHTIKKGWRRVHTPRSASLSDDDGYSCVIAKTADGGATWHNVMYEAKNYYPNGIDCVSATHCVAVGEGFNEKAGGHVWVTFDGLTFTETLHLKDNATGQFSIMSVKFNGENEVWVGGSFASQSTSTGLIYYSQDGGQTWTPHERLEFIGEITDISFTTGGVGFATAITIFQDSTILRYDASGPPQTPAPTWNGPVSQVQCSDDNCSVNCTTVTFAQDVCTGLNGGGSAIGQCKAGMLEQYVFPLSNNCTGLNEMEPMPCGVCEEASNGGSFVTYCSAVPPQSYEIVTGRSMLRRKKP
ncbi:membrane-associated protein, putative [Bodo saltans]|uniref:Membrane-associated protein, putative n=1 Tax=Bodo saltans TaxID=75058 RepID=A0A0S4JAK7_BODSA|nr:membrane-associated protein, putative [Bodo saltans]|eukprot:CUG87023.1 membrane-associated protein, putative [Bodo saltans]